MQVRTAEVAAALSLATDLGMRASFEHGLRSDLPTRCGWLGTRLGLDVSNNAEQRLLRDRCCSTSDALLSWTS